MIFSLYSLTLIVSAFLFSLIGCYLARYLLSLNEVMDNPNERSNHAHPVPRGGGIAVIFTCVSFLYVAGAPATILMVAAGIALVSFLDDRNGVAIGWRLAVQLSGVALLFVPNGIIDSSFNGLIFQGLLTPLMDKVIAVLFLVGFMNLFNFMDGIDGITGAQTIAIGIGFFALAFSISGLDIVATEMLIIASAAAGFLWLNWHPAKLFLGDVGSVALGFLLGFFLMKLAAMGHWQAALILPAYYLIDGGLTILKRLLTGQKIWEAHSQHAYQKAVRSGRSHHWVVTNISLLNVGLIILAVYSTQQTSPMPVISAYAIAFLVWGWLLLQRNAKPLQTVLTPQH